MKSFEKNLKFLSIVFINSYICLHFFSGVKGKGGGKKKKIKKRSSFRRVLNFIDIFTSLPIWLAISFDFLRELEIKNTFCGRGDQKEKEKKKIGKKRRKEKLALKCYESIGWTKGFKEERWNFGWRVLFWKEISEIV